MEELKIRCMFDHIITTMNTRKVSDSGIVLTSNEEGELLTKQTVLVAGPNANVSPGEEIELFMDRFKIEHKENAKYDIGPDRYAIKVPVEIINGKKYLFISSREVKYVYTK